MDWELGIGIRIGTWGLRLEIEIGDSDWGLKFGIGDWELGLGIEIWDRDWGLGLGLRIGCDFWLGRLL